MALYEALTPHLAVFFDSQTLQGADDWSVALQAAQRSARATVALVSRHSDAAYYQREEIAEAIHLERQQPAHHRVIPVYPHGMPDNVPYGFRLKTGYDYLRHGGLAGVAERLTLDLQAEQAQRNGDVSAVPRHPLTAFPRGPLVDASLLDRSLPQSYASLIRTSEAPMVIAEAAAFRRAADPSDGRVTVIERYHLPPPNQVPPYEYWLAAFSEALLHGPRMLAALLMVVPDDQFTQAAKAAKARLLETLANPE